MDPELELTFKRLAPASASAPAPASLEFHKEFRLQLFWKSLAPGLRLRASAAAPKPWLVDSDRRLTKTDNDYQPITRIIEFICHKIAIMIWLPFDFQQLHSAFVKNISVNYITF